MRSAGWTLATTVGFALGGAALHAPGASGVGAHYLDWDLTAAAFGAILGSVVGIVTALFQMVALGRRNRRLLAATVIAVAAAHGLADGAPAIWGVSGVAAISGLSAAAALAWALRTRAWKWVIASAFGWFAGWSLGVAIAGGLGLGRGSSPATWATEHAVIAGVLGLVWGSITSPAGRRLLADGRDQLGRSATLPHGGR